MVTFSVETRSLDDACEPAGAAGVPKKERD